MDILWAHTGAIGCIVLRLSRCHTSSVLAVLYKEYSLCSFIVIVLLCKQFFCNVPQRRSVCLSPQTCDLIDAYLGVL